MEDVCPSLTIKSLTHSPASPALSPRSQIIIGQTVMKQAAPEQKAVTPATGLQGRPSLKDWQLARLSWRPQASCASSPPSQVFRCAQNFMCCSQAQWAFQRSNVAKLVCPFVGDFCTSCGNPTTTPPTLTLYSLRLLSLQNTHIHIQCG